MPEVYRYRMKGLSHPGLATALTIAALLAGCMSSEIAPIPTRPVQVESSPSAAGGPARNPKDLPELAEESRVIAVLSSIGIQVDHIAVSKFQDLFRERRPARVFGSSFFISNPWRIDIVFFDGIRDVRVCPSPAGSHSYTILLNGERAGMASIQEVFFAAGDRLFVMASDVRARDALRTEFGLSIPPC